MCRPQSRKNFNTEEAGRTSRATEEGFLRTSRLHGRRGARPEANRFRSPASAIQAIVLQRVADAPVSRGFPQAIVADADFASPDIEWILEAHCAFPNTRGIRHAQHRRLNAPKPYDPLRDPAWQLPAVAKIWPVLRHATLPQADRACGSAHLRQSRHPDCLHPRGDADVARCRDHGALEVGDTPLRGTSEHHHEDLRFGSHDPDWSTQSIAPVVNEIMDAFGPQSLHAHEQLSGRPTGQELR